MTALPTRFEDVAALETFMSEPTPGLVADLARVDGDIMVLGVGGKMGPTLARMAKRAAPRAARHRRGAIFRPRAEGRARRSRRRDASPATCSSARRCSGCERGRRRAQPRLHGRPQVRRRRQCVADLDDERRRADDGGRDLQGHAHRLVLDRLRLSVRAGRRARRRRAGAGHAAGRRLRQFLRRPRAHVRVRLAQARHAGAHGAAVVRDRHALRRVVRRRQHGLRRHAARPDDGPCRRHLAGRCQRAGAAALGALHDAATPINITGPRHTSIRWLAGEFGRRFGRAPVSAARRRRPPGSKTRRRRRRCSGRRAWASTA